ncbi:MAG: 4-hydroxybenzoate polyprenyltransferase [Cyanobacteria bacterium K_Offshore_surface_m2_239]|nr:4-hydroxybenzoate polyprenyltransferase [Cyanobacteria bacterium K_Offshore_surface_m2_239]
MGFTPGGARTLVQRVGPWLELLRWHKPSGRLILLIPAGWALWLSPTSPPDPVLVGWIVLGGLAVSGAGCIANDLWDRKIDPRVERTKGRPLASGRVGLAAAWTLLALCLSAALIVVLVLPGPTRTLCVALALACLPLVLLYPSAKRWFPFPQLVLALCWGFAVLIPWAASGGPEGFAGGAQAVPLALTWLAAVVWTFGFDTVYAMSDREDDRRIGIRSSALTLGGAAAGVVAVCYAFTAVALAGAALLRGMATPPFWLLWGAATLAMQREAALLRQPAPPPGAYGAHFSHQVLLGGLLLLALVVGRAGTGGP